MSHEESVISSTRMRELGEYSKFAPLPIWVVYYLESDFDSLGLYARIASAAALESDHVMRVTVSKEWAQALFSKEGAHAVAMRRLLDVGAITKVAEYGSGKVRLQMEAYPPVIRQELDLYRRPDGKLVATLA